MFKRFGKYFLVFGLVSGCLFVWHPVTVYADVSPAAQLLDENENPYSSTGTRVTVTNGGNMYGLANDGTNVYIIKSDGDVVSVPFSSVDIVPGGSDTVTGTLHDVGWGGAAPAWPSSSELSLAYSKGCLFITNASNSQGNIKLYCIDVSDYSVTELTVPGDKPLPPGGYYAYSNLIDFPDGRIGKVSAYEDLGGGVYRSILRTYTITGTGKNATLTWSEDIVMTDTSNWAVDEHGLGTDGTYLYRIQWRDVNPNTKVWQLASGATSTVVYSGNFTRPFDNMHFLAHNHLDNYYIVGYFSSNQFFITTAADPGPGPGNPLTPEFGTTTPTATGFTVQITNYDADFTWAGEATNGGSVFISGAGLITVTGLAPGASSTVTISTERDGFPDGAGEVTGSTIPDDGDGVNVETENDAPNSGDGNDDGTLDSEQETVASLKNEEVSSTAYITLEIDNTDCSALIDVSVAAAPADSGYEYPVGLLDFDAACTSGGSTTVTVYYDKEYETADWMARKYINGTYATISDAVFGTATIGSSIVTTLTYTLTDGGPFDADGIANGTIEDPVGPAIPVARSGGSSGTSLDGQIRNLLRNGDVQKALDLVERFPTEMKKYVPLHIEVLERALAELFVTPAMANNIMVRDLEAGMAGEDVRKLQQLLNTQGYPLAASGPGAVGNETDQFGVLTQQALKRYQAANNIAPTSGYFGPITRIQMKAANLSGLWW